METHVRWYQRHDLLLELFVLVNLAFLAPDIYLAHATNSFRHWAEYIPLSFSLVSPVLLALALVCRGWGWFGGWYWLGLLVGAGAVVIGVAGLVWHLESRFFLEWTLEALVYTAPFAAPLAYTGIGLLVLMNRLVDPQSAEWPLWVLLLALGGFLGNFIFSLADHAQNGFFYWEEWIPVVSSALAVGFLLVPFLMRVGRAYLIPCAVVLLLQAAVGLLGFYYHNDANLHGRAPRVIDNLIYGAPALAPLLFPNLVLLALLGLWVWRPHLAPAP
jgi:hypothetical protein